MIGGCASDGRRAAPDTPAASTPLTYTVRPHDTLYSIAWRHDLDFRELAKWNNVGPDFKLTVGQVLKLRPTRRSVARASPPSTPAPPASASLPAKPAQPVPGQGRVGKPGPLDNGAAPAGSPAADSGAAPPRMGAADGAAHGLNAAAAVSRGGGLQWVWPTESVSAPRPVPGGGILLLGRLGQDVRAAGAGRVVYTGSGIRGYGNLVIIKHGDSLLTSYAHNRELLVHEGQEVSMGQVIAHMGTGPHQVCALYFEIRVNGRPTDPLHYLNPKDDPRRASIRR